MSAAGDPISVVVPTRDRSAMLDVCLGTIRAALRDDDELLVVDSASSGDGVRDAAKAHGARYLRCDLPGASRARNLGWRNAANPVVAFVDDDVRVAAGWADAWRQAFAENDGIAFMTGRIGVPPDQEAERPVALKDGDEPEVLDASHVGCPGHSANMAVRRSALQAVAGFDERMGPGSDFLTVEDRDLFDRFYAAGMLGRYEPRAQAVHDQWRDRRALLRLDWTYGFGMGARLAKLIRSGHGGVRPAVRETFWSWGLGDVFMFLRLRRKFLALTSLVRVTGAVAGLLRCLPVGIRDGHFKSRGPLSITR